MKKLLLWGMLAFASLAFIACPPDGTDETPDGPRTPSGWAKGLTDFDIQTGGNPGEVKYSFTATDPAATTYNLHYT
ncbi:MAG: hypothetical protein LBI06_09115, partial [Treponema sp.]|nr:hypothetical protein [Treponema sp.]